MNTRKLSRRSFLRGSGVLLALPVLEARLPRTVAAGKLAGPRRLVAVATGLGMHAPLFFPEQPGRDFKLSPYLEPLRDFRDAVTVFSGVSHPQVSGHAGDASFLTAAPLPGSPAFRNTVSLDQLAAERLGSVTRFPSLTLGRESMSWTRSGVMIPSEASAARLFARLFLAGSPEEVRTQVRRLRDGQSIMDHVLQDAKRMQADLGKGDREKIDEYFDSVRSVEQRLHRGEDWVHKPKPRVNVPPPQDVTSQVDTIGQTRKLYDLIHLALQTDSTRFVTVGMGGHASVLPVPGVTQGWHDLSHHSMEPGKIAELRLLETEIMKVLGELLAKLKGTREEDETLLDRTMVLFGSNLGNASSHESRNLPILLAGGCFKHGAHLLFDKVNNLPLSNLYVTMLQRLGLEFSSFGSSTGTIRGLEMT